MQLKSSEKNSIFFCKCNEILFKKKIKLKFTEKNQRKKINSLLNPQKSTKKLQETFFNKCNINSRQNFWEKNSFLCKSGRREIFPIPPGLESYFFWLIFLQFECPKNQTSFNRLCCNLRRGIVFKN